MNEIKEFLAISKNIGKNKSYTQAGGGNISIKTAENKMIIKASGFAFSEIRDKKGYVMVNCEKIRNFFNGRGKGVDVRKNEADYNKVLADSIIYSNKKYRPSMETGMHAYLDKVVIHVHPVVLNILTCMKTGKNLASKIFSKLKPAFLWIDYKNPGYTLASEIKKEVSNYERISGCKPTVILLKNHGIIVSENTRSKCENLINNITTKAINYFKKRLNTEFYIFRISKMKNRGGWCFSSNHMIKRFTRNMEKHKKILSKFLIPDDVIYCSLNFSFKKKYARMKKKDNVILVKDFGIFYPWNRKKSSKINEVLTAKLYISEMASKLGNINYLDDNDVNYILNMESEKYRKI